MLPSARVSHAAGKITLTWETSNDPFWVPASQAVINAYTRLHPNVSVTLIKVPSANYDQKLFLQAASGTLPDVVRTSDGETVPLASHHILLDMQPYVDADPSFNVNDIYQNFLNLGRLPGQKGLYMMPFSADAVLMFYNKDMFDKAGVAYPTAKWTYQDFLSAAQKLTLRDSSGKVTQWAIGGTSGLTGWWATYAPWLRGFGGDVLTADGKHSNLSSSGSLAGLQALADLVLKYKVEPGPSVVFPSDPFISGHAAIEFSVHGAVAGFSQSIGKKFKWDVQVAPSFPNGSHWNGEGTAGWAVSAGSKNRSAAWDMVKFVGSVQGQTVLAKLGVTMPIRKSMLTSQVWQTPGLNNQAFVQAIKTGMLPPQISPLDAAINCGTVYFGLTNTTIATMFSQILHGTPVATAAKTADAAINGCASSVSS
jgi:multiple sugar transport system substrate-binding protein